MNAKFNVSTSNTAATLTAVRSNTLIDKANRLRNAAKINGMNSLLYKKLLGEWADKKAIWMTYADVLASDDRMVKEAMVYLGMIDTNIAVNPKAHVTGYDPKTGEFYTWDQTLLYTMSKGRALSVQARAAIKAYNESGMKVLLNDMQIQQVEVALMAHYGKLRARLLDSIRLFDRATEAISMTKDGLAWSQWIKETFPACPEFINGKSYKDAIQVFLANRIGMVKFERLLNTVDLWDAKLNLEVPKLVADGSTSDVSINAVAREAILNRIDETYALGKELSNKLFVNANAITFRTEADFLAWADGQVTNYLEDKYDRDVNETIAAVSDEVVYQD